MTLIGQTLDDRYVIESKIASGGYGTVYRARWVEPGRSDQPVALKVVHAHHASDPFISARFHREVAALSSLASRHTVHTYGASEDRMTGTQFLVMELLEGESLHYRFGRCGALPWRTALSVIRQVCESLAEPHALGIVHRDLKPANIFLANKDFVKVLDFGIAKVMERSRMAGGAPLTEIGQAIGTPEYMSPEQMLGRALDGRSDIYTLGVVMYQLITGARPFPEKDLPTLITSISTKNPVPLSRRARWPVPPSLDLMVHRCLERDAKHRYGNVKQLANAIDEILAERQDKTTMRQWDIFGVDDDQRTGPIAALQSLRDPQREAAIRMPLAETARMGQGSVIVVRPPEMLARGSLLSIDQRPVVAPRRFLAVKLVVALMVLVLIGLAIATFAA